MSALRKFIHWNKTASYAMGKRFPRLFAFKSYGKELKRRIAAALGPEVEKVLEAGGIDRPLLEKSERFEYVGVDIEERPSCYEVYDRFIVQSIEEPVGGGSEFDLVISTTLLEHVPNNVASVNSMYHALVPGGETHHYVPSKWHPYAVALRIVGPTWQKKLIPILRPGTEDETGYPTYFDQCTGSQMVRVFERAGFEEIRIEYFYWATDYFSFLLPLYFLMNLYEQACYRLGLSALASGFVISARKPNDAAAESR